MSALHEVHRAGSHVVAQVIEAELVVRTEGYIAGVSLAAGVAVGFVLVDAINGQAVEHVQRPHPLRVTLGEVVVHGYNVYALVRQRVQEHG